MIDSPCHSLPVLREFLWLDSTPQALRLEDTLVWDAGTRGWWTVNLGGCRYAVRADYLVGLLLTVCCSSCPTFSVTQRLKNNVQPSKFLLSCAHWHVGGSKFLLMATITRLALPLCLLKSFSYPLVPQDKCTCFLSFCSYEKLRESSDHPKGNSEFILCLREVNT